MKTISESRVNHFLTVSDFSKSELLTLIKEARTFKNHIKSRTPHRLLESRVLAMIFEKPSTRTRISFEVGIFDLGGKAININAQEIRMKEREPIKDVARTMSRYVDIIMLRVMNHDDLEEFAAYATVPVINGLSDLFHPCQVLADMMTIQEHCRRIEGIKIAFIGDGNNVCNSLINASNILDFELRISTPANYKPTINGNYTFLDSPLDAAKGADVIYTDVWTSMGQEAENEKRLKDFKEFTITSDFLNAASSEAIFLHCLPAHRGEEVTEEVFESAQSKVFDQAENRLHVQKAIMVKLLS